MTIRCFIAVELPVSLKKTLELFIDTLRPLGTDVTWAAPDTIHLTLAFLGNTEQSAAPLLVEAIRKKVSLFNSFCIKITGVGIFPSERRPRVLWVGIGRSISLERLQRAIADLVEGFGFATEKRPFSPHLTIGRVRSPQCVAELVSAFSRTGKQEFGTVEVTGVSLMQSILKASGAEHRCLAVIPLSGGKKDVKGIRQRSE